MNINLHNYEAFFLDYKEGNLSNELEKELFLFLEKHPKLYEELHDFENVVLEDFNANEVFLNKNHIKKTSFTNEDLIAYAEGLLNAKEKNRIDILASQNNAFKKELNFYQNSHLKPNLNEKFKNKSSLKKGGLIIALQNNYTFLRVAAAILLLIGLFFLVSKLNTKENINKNPKEIADVNLHPKAENQESRIKIQEPTKIEENKNSKNEIANAVPKSKNESQESRIKIQEPVRVEENKNPKVATNTFQVNNIIVQNENNQDVKDSAEKIIIASANSKQENQNTIKSYYNISPDNDDNENITPVTASAAPVKKSFFQKLVKVAKKVNDLGVKKINAAEENTSNSLSIGSFVVSESTSN